MKSLKYILLWTVLLAGACRERVESAAPLPEGAASLANDKVAVAIGEDGSLLSLRNVETGQDYAGGGLLWRLYYDAPYQKEIQILGSGQTPEISCDGKSIVLNYSSLKADGRDLDIKLRLTLTIEDDKIRFASALRNDEPHTVLRELHYPLVHGASLPEDHKLFISEYGGKLFDSPVKEISKTDLDEATDIYDLQGHKVQKEQMRRGAYIVKTKQGTCKIVVK